MFSEVSFDASDSYDQDGTELEYYFDFGDGSNSDWITDSMIKHTYTVGPDDYFIELKVKDSDGEINTTTIEIFVDTDFENVMQQHDYKCERFNKRYMVGLYGF